MSRIQNTAKSYGLILFERFVFLDLELDMYGSTALISSHERPPNPNADIANSHFTAIAFVADTGTVHQLSGTMDTIPEALNMSVPISPNDKTRVMFETGGDIGVRVFLAKRAVDAQKNPGILIGVADTVKLWGIGYDNILPPLTEACILDQTRNVLFSSFPLPPDILHRIRFESDSLESRSLEYTSDGEGMFIGYWPMFLRSQFEGPNLIVVLRTMHKDVFAPLSHFKQLFPLVALLSFWIVLFLSTISIRKSMVPLEKLREGASRLARRDFDTRVEITSGDEFESLAETLNKSAARLGRHFNAMEAMANIDRAIHASLNAKTIATLAMKHMYDFFSCATISFGVIHGKKKDIIHLFTCSSMECDTLHEDYLTLCTDDKKGLSRQIEPRVYDLGGQIPSSLSKAIDSSTRQILVMPLFHNKNVAGLICLGHTVPYAYSEEDLSHIKRLTNQLSAALSNALLVEELESLNWGTLEALARTVDAKSKWTAGHSERVAELAVKIANVMGLDEKEIDNLHRAAFLHDIGKIGIPMIILDKPEKLTEEEYKHVKEHPVIGAKIIEPIEAYADAIPIILQHHERFDGNGYPHGLSGEDVNLGARILAVADVFDAIISSRPYRQGWVEEKVIQLITEESGKHFDPRVVEAFLVVNPC